MIFQWNFNETFGMKLMYIALKGKMICTKIWLRGCWEVGTERIRSKNEMARCIYFCCKNDYLNSEKM